METNRPYIICHMMTTLDGKIATGTDTDILGEFFDLYMKTEDQLETTSWFLGRKTMEMFAKGEQVSLENFPSELEIEDYIENKSDNGYMFTIDTKGSLRFNQHKVKLENYKYDLPIVVIVTEQTPMNYLSYLQEQKINYIFSGEKEVDLNIAVKKIYTGLKVEKLLLEGGGLINGSFLNVDLVDEISLLLVPQVLNLSSAPSLFDNDNKNVSIKDFSLESFEKVEKDCMWMRYKRV